MSVHSGEHPVAVPAFQLEVGRLDQVRPLHVDQPVPEHVGPEQHLPVAPVEPAQVELGACQLQHLAVERTDLLDRHVDLPAADRGDQPGHHRVLLAAEPDDDIGKPPERLAPAVRERAPQQLRQVQRARAACLWCRCGRCRRHGIASLIG